MPQEEKKIIKGILAKNDRVLFGFYKSHHIAVFRYIHRQISQKEIAEELTQDVFLDFIESLRDFRGESSLKTYLFTIARYKVIDHIKKKKIKKILFSALPKYVVENIVGVFMDDEIERKDLATRIEQAIDALPNEYRVIIRLKYKDGMKIKEIATRLMLSPKAVESALFRARKAFMKAYRCIL